MMVSRFEALGMMPDNVQFYCYRLEDKDGEPSLRLLPKVTMEAFLEILPNDGFRLCKFLGRPDLGYLISCQSKQDHLYLKTDLRRVMRFAGNNKDQLRQAYCLNSGR